MPATHPTAEMLLRGILAADRAGWFVREMVARHARTPASILKALAADANWFVRVEVANNPNTPDSALRALAADPDPRVSRAVPKSST